MRQKEKNVNIEISEYIKIFMLHKTYLTANEAYVYVK